MSNPCAVIGVGQTRYAAARKDVTCTWPSETPAGG
jgi:hypothetical protein